MTKPISDLEQTRVLTGVGHWKPLKSHLFGNGEPVNSSMEKWSEGPDSFRTQCPHACPSRPSQTTFRSHADPLLSASAKAANALPSRPNSGSLLSVPNRCPSDQLTGPPPGRPAPGRPTASHPLTSLNRYFSWPPGWGSLTLLTPCTIEQLVGTQKYG